MTIDFDNFTQEMLDFLLETATPEPREREQARRLAQDTIGRAYDRGLVAFDSNWNCYLVEKK
jgi:hypothetical protein